MAHPDNLFVDSPFADNPFADNMLSVHDWHNQYYLSKDQGCPQAVVDRFDKIVESELALQLQNHLQHWFDQDAEGVVILDQLNIELDLDCDNEDDDLARRWAAQFSKNLYQATESGHGVIYFKNEAEYLSRFLIDLASGHSWNSWYYRKFEGLKPLPVTVALGTALVEHPETGIQALLQLDSRQLSVVLNAISNQQARNILWHFCSKSSCGQCQYGRCGGIDDEAIQAFIVGCRGRMAGCHGYVSCAVAPG